MYSVRALSKPQNDTLLKLINANKHYNEILLKILYYLLPDFNYFLKTILLQSPLSMCFITNMQKRVLCGAIKGTRGVLYFTKYQNDCKVTTEISCLRSVLTLGLSEIHPRAAVGNSDF